MDTEWGTESISTHRPKSDEGYSGVLQGTATTGHRAGRPSVRLLVNTLRRLYLVHEWDHTSHDDQARYIKYLCQWGPLVMVVDSGGESFHAWWDTTIANEEGLKRFYRLGCLLGAEPTKYPPNSYFRLPGGARSENGQLQRIVYFDPSKIGCR